MTDLLLNWFSLYGIPLVLVALVFGQMGIPVPTSILLLTIGAMLVDSVYNPLLIFAVAVVGAVIGDQIGYWLGRRGGEPLVERLKAGKYAKLMARAEYFSTRFGAFGVFITRWLVSPVGPYVNYVVGMTKLSWSKFTTMSIAGESIWIGLYLGLGYAFSKSIASLNDFLANFTWFAGALIVTVFLALRFFRQWRRAAAEKRLRSNG